MVANLFIFIPIRRVIFIPKCRHISDTHPWAILYQRQIPYTFFSPSILFIRSKLIIFLSFMQSNFRPLWAPLRADLNNNGLYLLSSKHFQRYFVCMQTEFSLKVKSVHLLPLFAFIPFCMQFIVYADCTVLGTTDLNCMPFVRLSTGHNVSI